MALLWNEDFLQHVDDVPLPQLEGPRERRRRAATDYNKRYDGLPAGLTTALLNYRTAKNVVPPFEAGVRIHPADLLASYT